MNIVIDIRYSESQKINNLLSYNYCHQINTALFLLLVNCVLNKPNDRLVMHFRNLAF